MQPHLFAGQPTMHIRLRADNAKARSNTARIAMLVALEQELATYVTVDHGHTSSQGDFHVTFQLKKVPPG